MALPIVVIVGRPNVGKSSLLNAVARERISIVDPRAGITRDRVSAVIEAEDRYFELVDTGGIGIVDDHQLEAHVEGQIQYALAQARMIIFITDVRDGVTPMDETIAQMLRKLDLPVLLAVNKVDDQRLEPEVGQFAGLGLGEPLIVSAHHGRGRRELIERILAEIGGETGKSPGHAEMRLAIIGKRNAGKSTLVNALAGEDRVIVSEIPGTTRDAVDVRFEFDGRQFLAIDTAGVRKKKSMGDVDFYSYSRALRSIRRCDVVLYMIDATVAVSEVDLKLMRAVLDEYKPVVIAINKWDLAKGRASAEDFGHYLTEILPMYTYAPVTFITAKTGRNVLATVEVAQSLFKQARTRLTTGQLNRVLRLILEARGPSAKHGTKPVKIYYGTQVATAPPTVVFFCNSPDNVTENYRRFMENRLREVTAFKEVPIRLLFRPRGREG